MKNEIQSMKEGKNALGAVSKEENHLINSFYLKEA